MIQKTFLFLDGISRKKEENIKNQGINDWDGFLDADKIKGISSSRKAYYDRKIKRAKKALLDEDVDYFNAHLRFSEQWRLYEHFKEDAIYLDIETDGVGRYCDVTVVGLYDGFNTKLMIRDINLNIEELKLVLRQYKMLVTFNGTVFDVPFLEKRYPNLFSPMLHVDLRHCCARVGLTGGLKEVERRLGIKRNKIVEDLYGGDVLRLWKMYKVTGDEHYLELLVEYNEEDCVNLKKIAEVVVGRLKKA
ncbi:MAG: ribonuclease H-like domain-containing protein [Candidatus Woesearchaeota archaeon]|jgi:hypothetical protein|nr:ribonuclease H-like domain-containing protein [Candidatus Woesearchaeota archaeon]MDP7323525.1 ribonuclease H-like domain-containing protein [Candidatus Woesearchaeota archaeon]MDP7458580.1 ribonuclease H-like domain-containing protein [Candidatus Woesearchaeota archaeon]